jgi:hypothetical protein
MAMKLQIEHMEARIERDLERGELQALEGVLQRANYQSKELTVIAAGQVWYFRVDPDCQLWFNDKQAILRCFHSLDLVKIVYSPSQPKHVIKALYAWDKQAA